jgi:hypothetical protein
MTWLYLFAIRGRRLSRSKQFERLLSRRVHKRYMQSCGRIASNSQLSLAAIRRDATAMLLVAENGNAGKNRPKNRAANLHIDEIAGSRVQKTHTASVRLPLKPQTVFGRDRK